MADEVKIDYMAQLEHCARQVAMAEDVDALGLYLKDLWANIETTANRLTQDAFFSDMYEPIKSLAKALYRVPSTRWEDDVQQLVEKDREYGGSWQKRGGRGAYFMMARKWDRVETQMARHGDRLSVCLRIDKRQEGILDDLGDLRRYCLLILSYHRAVKHQEETDAQKLADANQDIPF